jgi:hypothetical protein
MQKKICLLLLFAGLVPAGGWAQNTQQNISKTQTLRRAEVAIGYTAVRANAPPDQSCGCFWMQGGSAQLALYSQRGLGVVLDLGMTTASRLGSGNGYNITLGTYMVGPRYRFYDRKRFSTYAQALAGAGHASTNAAADNGSTAFSFSTGAGLDLLLKRRVSWRVVQAEYLLTRIPNGNNDVQNQFRLTTGIILHLK